MRGTRNIPLRSRSVDTKVETIGVGSGDESLEEGLVGGLRAGPVLSSLDVEPELAVLDIAVAESLDGLVDLGSGGGRAGGTGEEVDVHVAHAAGPGVGDRGGAVGVGDPVALVGADHGEVVAVADEALEAAGGGQLADVNARVGGSSGEQSRQDEQ